MDKETVDKAREEAEQAWTKFSLLKDAYIKAESDYIKKLSRFKNFDYELAQVDGRLKKVPPSGERKPKKQAELTLDQLKSIAATLGVNISVEEPEEEFEEEIEGELEIKEEVKEKEFTIELSDEDILKRWEELENEKKV